MGLQGRKTTSSAQDPDLTQLTVSVLPRTAAQARWRMRRSAVACPGSGKARGGAWFHTVWTQGPSGLGKRPQKQSGGLGEGLADLVLFLDLPMPNDLLPETKF